METFMFRGFIAPVFTPFNNDATKSLNLDVILEYAQYLANANISGILVNATSGEGTSLTVSERKLITEAWARACLETHQHFMVQIGGASFPDVLNMAKHAEAHNADSILCLPDLFHAPTTINELIQYLQLIAEAAPNTPLLYYHTPSFTKVNLDMGIFLNEVANKVPTFAGIQFTSTALDEGLAAVMAHDKKFAVFLGTDSIMAGAFAQGFDSVIGTTLNIFPEHAVHIYEAIRNGNIQDAQFIQEHLNSAIKAITKNGSWVSTMKETMSLLTSVDVGPVRSPLIALTATQIKQIKIDLEDVKVIRCA